MGSGEWGVETKLPVYILAGGKSSRFGSDKARALLNGEALVARIVRVLGPVAVNFTAVANVSDKYIDLKIRTIADERAELGPMGGLLTSLRDAPSPGWILLCSCDMVALDCGWVELLAAARAKGSVAAGFKGERVEPLFALYHTALLERVERAIAAGQLSPAKLLEESGAKLLALPPNWPRHAHVNTPEELAECEREFTRKTE